jgi:hypothetical protein
VLPTDMDLLRVRIAEVFGDSVTEAEAIQMVVLQGTSESTIMTAPDYVQLSCPPPQTPGPTPELEPPKMCGPDQSDNSWVGDGYCDVPMYCEDGTDDADCADLPPVIPECGAGQFKKCEGADSVCQCMLCPAGTYSSATGDNVPADAGACTACPMGTFSPVNGASGMDVCTACPTGMTTAAVGVADVSLCVTETPIDTGAPGDASCSTTGGSAAEGAL